MKTNVYSLQGKKAGTMELPPVMDEDIRPDLIKRAVLSSQTARYQPQGRDIFAGKRTSAKSVGPGKGVSRVPRVKGSGYSAGGKGAFIPHAVGGRITHPPRTEKRIIKKINAKERRKATKSAIAATGLKELVEKRGHLISRIPEIPVIVEDGLEGLKSSKEVKDFFSKLGLSEDVERAEITKIRAGKGTLRGRKYRKKKSVLIVISEDKGLSTGSGNFQGVDVVKADNLGVEHLAPGTHYGRLTVYTKSAIKILSERFK